MWLFAIVKCQLKAVVGFPAFLITMPNISTIPPTVKVVCYSGGSPTPKEIGRRPNGWSESPAAVFN